MSGPSGGVKTILGMLATQSAQVGMFDAAVLSRPLPEGSFYALLAEHGDRIVRDAIAALFEDEEVSPRAIIRWKDIFEALEQAIDACDTAAHVLGNIVVKNA